MSLRTSAADVVPLENRFKAVLSVGVRGGRPGVLPLLSSPELREITLLSSASFADNFYAISAYCSTHKKACDVYIWKLLIENHSVPLEYIDIGIEGDYISINSESSQIQIAEYLEVVAKTVRSREDASEFTRVVLKNAPAFVSNARDMIVAKDGTPYIDDLDKLSEEQKHMYGVQMKALRFVFSQRPGELVIENSSKTYQGFLDRRLIKDSLEKGLLNYNLDWLKFVWENFVSIENSRDGDLADRLFLAANGTGDIWLGKSWEFKITAFAYYTRAPVSLLEKETGNKNKSFFRNQLEHAEAVEWIFGKLLYHGFEFHSQSILKQCTLVIARKRVEDAKRIEIESKQYVD